IRIHINTHTTSRYVTYMSHGNFYFIFSAYITFYSFCYYKRCTNNQMTSKHLNTSCILEVFKLFVLTIINKWEISTYSKEIDSVCQILRVLIPEITLDL